MTTLMVMNSDLNKLVALQIDVRKGVRNRLRNSGTNTDLTMSALGDLLLDYGLSLIESGKPPPELAAMIKKAQKEAAAD